MASMVCFSSVASPLLSTSIFVRVKCKCVSSTARCKLPSLQKAASLYRGKASEGEAGSTPSRKKAKTCRKVHQSRSTYATMVTCVRYLMQRLGAGMSAAQQEQVLFALDQIEDDLVLLRVDHPLEQHGHQLRQALAQRLRRHLGLADGRPELARLERDDLVAFLSFTDSELEDAALRLVRCATPARCGRGAMPKTHRTKKGC